MTAVATDHRHCCSYNSTDYAMGSILPIPEKCSILKCMEINDMPSWMFSSWFEGCGCCMYKGKMVENGFEMKLDSCRNFTCCDGRLLSTMDPDFGKAEKDCTDPTATHASIGFSIDNTGSVSSSSNSINKFSQMLMKEIIEREYNIPKYVLTTFNDFGDGSPLNTQLVADTDDPEKFKKSVLDISYGGGGDGPERMTLGLLLTLQTMPSNGLVVVFTDHQSKDLELKDKILELKEKKSVDIYIILTPYYKGSVDDESWKVYKEIGSVFDIKDFNATSVADKVLDYVYENCD